MTSVIDWTKPIQTVEGKPARVLCMDRKCGIEGGPVVCLVSLNKASETVLYYQRDGKYWASVIPSQFDMRNVPEPKRAYYYFVYEFENKKQAYFLEL